MKFKVYWILFVFSLFLYSNASAFFIINDHSKTIRLNKSRISQSPAENSIFFFYDNFSNPSGNNILCKKHDNFIFFDRIKIDIPLQILYRQAISPEASLDRMLIANLRFKKLIEEYKLFQQNVKYFLDQSPEIGYMDYRPVSGENNIQNEINRLDQTFDNITKFGSVALNRENSGSFILPESHSFLKNSLEKMIDTKTDEISFVNLTDSPKKPVSDIDEYGIHSKSVTKTSKELPWIINFIFNILKFILENRIEIILFSASIIFLGFIIFFGVRQ